MADTPDAPPPAGGDEPDVPRIAATLQAFLVQAEALRAVLLLDRGPEAPPLLVDCLGDGTVEVEEGMGGGDGAGRTLPESEWLGSVPLGPLPEIRAFPAVEVDLSAATLSAPLGALDMTGRAVRDLATLFPGGSVLTVGFETTDPHRPLFLAARRGEPLVASLGDEEYELPPDWPAG